MIQAKPLTPAPALCYREDVRLRRGYRRESLNWLETRGIRYGDASKIPVIIFDVKAMLKAHQDIDHGQTLIVNFNSFGASSLDFFIYTFTRTTDWVHFHEIKQDVLLKVLDIIHSHAADVAFPTTTLDMPEPVVISQSDK